MRKIKTFLRRVASGSFKRFFRNLNIVHKESGKNRIALFFDMVYCMLAYGVGYLDYRTNSYSAKPSQIIWPEAMLIYRMVLINLRSFARARTHSLLNSLYPSADWALKR